MWDTPKVIVIKENDTFLEIIDRIERVNAKKIHLHIHEKNNILAHHINLKYIKVNYLLKDIKIITTNKHIKHIAEKLWFEVFFTEDIANINELVNKKLDTDNVVKYNYTPFEYFVYELKRVWFFITRFLRKKKEMVYKKKTIWSTSGSWILILGLLMSIFLLAFIFYFAISKTTITIIPERNVKNIIHNITFYDNIISKAQEEINEINKKEKNWEIIKNKKEILEKLNKNKEIYNSLRKEYSVPLERITHKEKVSQIFKVATIDEGSAWNARWTIELTNELWIKQTYKPRTRFVTDTWIVLRATDWITVPPTRRINWKLVIWKVKVNVIADARDEEWRPVWARWNLKPWVLLTLPWLKANRNKVYARVIEPLIWWKDATVHILTQDDLDRFYRVIKNKAEKQVYASLKRKLLQEQTDDKKLKIIDIDWMIDIYTETLEIWGWLDVWANIDEVKLSLTAVINTYVYNKVDIENILKNILKDKLLHKTEKILYIDENSFNITDIINREDNPLRIKATAKLDAVISYNFEEKQNSLSRKLKKIIANTWEKEARSLLINNPYIADVKMKFSPFWLSRVSSNTDNIYFKLGE